MTPKTIPFWDEFVKRFGTAPVYTGVGTYDAVHVYAEAVRRANSLDTDAVIKALEKTDMVGMPARSSSMRSMTSRPARGCRILFLSSGRETRIASWFGRRTRRPGR
jgi:Periplasmic binding protein